MPQPPDLPRDVDASERKYRSRKRVEEAESASAVALPQATPSAPKPQRHPFARPLPTEVPAPTPTPAAAPPVAPARIVMTPALDRGGKSTPRRVDIVLPNPANAFSASASTPSREDAPRTRTENSPYARHPNHPRTEETPRTERTDPSQEEEASRFRSAESPYARPSKSPYARPEPARDPLTDAPRSLPSDEPLRQSLRPLADPPRATRQLPSPERAAPPRESHRRRFWEDPMFDEDDEEQDDEEQDDEAYPDDPPATSRIVQLEREGVAALKKHWISVLIGVFGVAVILTLFVLSGQWVRETQRKDEARKREEAELAERAAYPLKYQDLIEANAADFDLDPAFVAAIIMKESSFRPESRSNKEAQGLMQIVPATADQIAGMLDEPGFTVDRIFEPEVNIRFGCRYLRYLLDSFHNDLKVATCAYHAGEGNVRSWLANEAYSADGITLTTIPTEGIVDTVGYYAYVMKAIGIYHKYYYPTETEATASPSPAE